MNSQIRPSMQSGKLTNTMNYGKPSQGGNRQNSKTNVFQKHNIMSQNNYNVKKPVNNTNLYGQVDDQMPYRDS